MTTWGAALYRTAFAVFIIACLFNAYDSFTTYVQADQYLIQGISAADKLYETYAFLGLTVILTFEAIGLFMYKWVKRSVPHGVVLQ